MPAFRPLRRYPRTRPIPLSATEGEAARACAEPHQSSHRTLSRLRDDSTLDAMCTWGNPGQNCKSSLIASRPVGYSPAWSDGMDHVPAPAAGKPRLCAPRRYGSPPVCGIWPSTPPPPSSDRFAALAIASTASVVISTCAASIRERIGGIGQPSGGAAAIGISRDSGCSPVPGAAGSPSSGSAAGGDAASSPL